MWNARTQITFRFYYPLSVFRHKNQPPRSRSDCVFICLLFSEPMTAEEHTENQRSPVTCSPVICYLIAAKLR